MKKSKPVQVEADYGRPKDGLGRVMSSDDLQTLATEQTSPAKEPYAGVKSPNAAMGSPPGPLALLVKVESSFLMLGVLTCCMTFALLCYLHVSCLWCPA